MAKKQPDWAGGAKAAYRLYRANQQLSALGASWAKLKADAYELGVVLMVVGIIVLISFL